MDSNIEIHFAGLAKNCSNVLRDNLDSLIDICNNLGDSSTCKIWVAENDSNDNTRRILKEYDDGYCDINIMVFDELDEKFPVRVTRLAYLREVLFNEIKYTYIFDKDTKKKYLYVPVDLDSNIAKSIDSEQFLKECERVASGKVNAIFPISTPYYYDIYALRSEGWVEKDPFDEIEENRDKYGLLLSKLFHMYSKQKSVDDLKLEGRQTVQSAFGGVGIYDINETLNTNYKKGDGDGREFPVETCEHVVFNMGIKSKEISPEFVVQAPDEHISFKTSWYSKAKISTISIVSDIKRLVT